MEKKYATRLDEILSEHNDIKAQSTNLDQLELYRAKLDVRPEKEKAAEAQIHNIDGRFSIVTWLEAKRSVANLLNKKEEHFAARQLQRRRQREQKVRRSRGRER